VLKTDIVTVKTDVGEVKGKGLETHYRLNRSPFFGVLLCQVHVLSTGEVGALLDAAVDQGKLSLDDSIQVRRADLVVEGKRRNDGIAVYLVVEVSWVVDIRDVERAAALAKELKVWQPTEDAIIEPAA
jgi:hypothetical protein